MSLFIKQDGATVPVSRIVIDKRLLVLGQGGPYVHYTTGGGAAHPRIRHRVYTTDLSPLRRSVAGRDPDHGTAHDQRRVADGVHPGPGTSIHLPPRLVPATLV